MKEIKIDAPMSGKECTNIITLILTIIFFVFTLIFKVFKWLLYKKIKK